MVMASTIAVLFARADSNYKVLPGCDVWDFERDALNWPGGSPVVAHPPCRGWGRMRQFSQASEAEKAMALWAVDQVRRFGGVLEHPESSSLWPAAGLPALGKRDAFGGWTLGIHQHEFGHRAEKATFLYIVGCEPANLPEMPLRLDEPTHCIRPTKSYPRKPSVTKAEREHTPAALAAWLCEVARRAGASKGVL
jgi:hypothetical protein